MADVHDKKTRSFNMSRIRYKDTKPELLVRKYLLGFLDIAHEAYTGRPVPLSNSGEKFSVLTE